MSGYPQQNYGNGGYPQQQYPQQQYTQQPPGYFVQSTPPAPMSSQPLTAQPYLPPPPYAYVAPQQYAQQSPPMMAQHTTASNIPPPPPGCAPNMAQMSQGYSQQGYSNGPQRNPNLWDNDGGVNFGL
ncbi:uncharacterized protein LOC134708284 [Mytilus trossulus]|uniref:uncharacterized protein LOC134708284 n=1 Tax=Mytilus trossulus TaxID=6551 RepID=UPI003007B9BA